jgi:hypothetical protein
MPKWKCPNLANVIDHPVKVLFSEDDRPSRFDPSQWSDQMRVPRPEYCEYCRRSYLKWECIEVRV